MIMIATEVLSRKGIAIRTRRPNVGAQQSRQEVNGARTVSNVQRVRMMKEEEPKEENAEMASDPSPNEIQKEIDDGNERNPKEMEKIEVR